MNDRNRKLILFLAFLLLIGIFALFLWSIHSPLTAQVRSGRFASSQTASGRYIPPPRTQETGCTYEGNGTLPDRECTPGAYYPDVTAKHVCTSGYSHSVRDVSQALKEQVYRNYGILHRDPGQYQIDHLVDLQLGGANDIANLWPQPDVPLPGANEKIKLGDLLNRLVCQGKMRIQDAQEIMSRNWVEGYRKFFPTVAP